MADLLDDATIDERLEPLDDWRREGDEIVLDREFKDFAAAIAWVDLVAAEAEAANHHPDILVHGWNKVRLTVTNHSAGGLTEADFDAQMDRKAWPALKEKLEKVFKSKTREDWCKIMEGSDICFAPILTMQEAPKHPHNAARNIFIERHGVTQPAPAPRFSRTPSAARDAVSADIGELTSAWKAGR